MLRRLTAKGGTSGFAIAGRDRKFVWADARIDGNSVVVSSPHIPYPVSVRYAWGDNPDVSLYNVEGLPASPFRTDDWSILDRVVAQPGSTAY
jgi:sialate O-acetylesterase